MQNGLRLEPRVVAEFDAQTAGLFMHYVLENVSREIKAANGFKNTEEKDCRVLTARYVLQYVREVLYDFEGKNARFIYLFRRLEEDVHRIVFDMLDELKHSDFEPLDFELDLSQMAKASACQEPVGLSLKGIVDRVDGWERGGKLYMRVIDYKTGRKSFDLSDVAYGMGMQMLMYLFALQKIGAARYGAEIAPAGVLYVPARDMVLKMQRSATEEEIKKKRELELRRGGLILSDPFVLDAMENGDAKKFLPVKLSKDGAVTGDSLVSLEQVELLSEYVSHMLRSAAQEILGGEIKCSPYYKNENDNACSFCDYHAVCSFDEELGDRLHYTRKMKPDEVWEELSRE
jgi:ATP-dependent helicase/nuclease subunit B